MTTAAHAGAAVSSYFHPCYIFFLYIYFYLFASISPSTETHFAYYRDALNNIEKGSMGFGLSAADCEMIGGICRVASKTSWTKDEEREAASELSWPDLDRPFTFYIICLFDKDSA